MRETDKTQDPQPSAGSCQNDYVFDLGETSERAVM